LTKSPPTEKGRDLLKLLRRLALPPGVKHWTLTTLREKLVKIGAKVVRHAKYLFFQMAEVTVPRKLCAAILNRIRRLRKDAAGLVLSG
jgi:Transposase DDE domain group 1